MKRWIIVGSVLLVALAAAFGLSRNSHREPLAENKKLPLGIENAGSANYEARLQPEASYKQDAHAESFAVQFSSSHNYLDFARAIIADARSGNPDAQYYLAKALAFCEISYRGNFHHNFREITLAEALALHPSDQRLNDIKTSIYNRCHDLQAVQDREIQFGKAVDWVKAAADHKQPGAQSQEALDVLQQKISVAGDETKPPPSDNNDPLSLLLAAVQTKDPEALANAGNAQGLLNQTYS